MMIERVEIAGFRSFRDHTVFEFSDAVGVVYLTGRNVDAPQLGTNACGKSSLWEAVYWCLYGVASSGLKGPEVSTWNAGRGIYVLVRINGHKVVRTWGSRNVLEVDGEEASQQEVDAIVGLTRQQFGFCAYMAQGEASFLDLQPTAKTDLIASVLNLDVWSRLSDMASDAAKKQAVEVQGVRDDIVSTKASIAEQEALDYTAKIDAWKDSVAEDAARDAKELAAYDDTISKARERIEDLEAGEQRGRKAVGRARDTLDDIEDDLRKADRALASTVHWLEQMERKTGVCPMCGTDLSRDHGHHAELERMRKQRAKQQAAVDELEEDRAALRKELSTAEGALRAIQDSLLDVRATLSAAERGRREAGTRAQERRSQRNPYIALALQRDERLEALRKRLARLEGALDKEQATHERLAYWVKGFKDVRLFLVTEAITQLEVETNSALVQLGLPDWAIRYAPDSETKGGEVRRGFSVLIESPRNPRPVPWRVWSGGEAQRLRLAAAMGLSSLIAAYTGYRPFVEVWDEPSDGMSPQGIKDMLATFEHRARASGRQVWVVDHSAFDSGAFVETVTAVNEGGTTRLERIQHGQGE